MTIYIALNTKLTEYSRYFKADDSELIRKTWRNAFLVPMLM